MLIGSSAVFRSSGVTSSGPTTRPFWSFLIAFWTSSRVGTSSRTSSVYDLAIADNAHSSTRELHPLRRKESRRLADWYRGSLDMFTSTAGAGKTVTEALTA